MSDIIHFIKAGNVNLSSAVGGPDPQFKTHEYATQANSSGVSLNYDNRFPEQYANLIKRDGKFYAGSDSRYIIMSGDSVSDADALGGFDGNYYLSYANFTGVAGTVSGVAFIAPSGRFDNLYTNNNVYTKTLSHSGNYTQELNNGTVGVNTTINWTNGNTQAITLSGNPIFTFTAPPGPARLQLMVKQDNTGARTVTWPNTVKWPAATAPTLTTSGNAVDIIAFWYNGTNYYGTSALAFG